MRVIRLVAMLLLPVALSAAGAQRPSPARADSLIAIVGGTLIDGNGGAPVPDAVVVEAAQMHLKVGVTTIRDSYGMLKPLIEARTRIARGDVPGPRMYVAGNIVGWGGPWSLSFTGRPPENLSLFQEQMNDAITEGGGEDLVNMEPESLRVAINRYLDKGPDFLKYGGTSHFGNPVFIGFSERAQKAIVDAVHARGKVAETHSTTPEGLRLSILAGIDLVQHPEVHDVPLSDGLVRLLGLAPEFRRDPKPDWQDSGTGTLASIEGLVELGMTPLQAITAAAKHGAMASKALAEYGTIETGKAADLLLFSADPSADIHNIRKLETVMEGGAIVDTKSLPTKPVWVKR